MRGGFNGWSAPVFHLVYRDETARGFAWRNDREKFAEEVNRFCRDFLIGRGKTNGATNGMERPISMLRGVA
jgi:hypothetical protein